MPRLLNAQVPLIFAGLRSGIQSALDCYCGLWKLSRREPAGSLRRANSVMRTVLRKSKLQLFFQGPDQWTADPQRAFNFKSIDRALRFIEQWHMDDVEVAFVFRNEKSVTRVPLEKVGVGFSSE